MINKKILDWKIKTKEFKDKAEYLAKKSKGKDCPKCKGNGFIQLRKDKPTDLTITQICSECNGNGFIEKKVKYPNL